MEDNCIKCRGQWSRRQTTGYYDTGGFWMTVERMKQTEACEGEE
jgi:hypothetical protein